MATSPPPSPGAFPTSDNKLQQLMAMGYKETQCAKALRIAQGDLDQAVGYLLLGEQSQQAFDFSARELICEDFNSPLLTAPNSNDSAVDLLGSSLPEGDLDVDVVGITEPQSSFGAASPEDQLVMMGFGRNQALHALRVSDGDVEQAIGFLSMGDSRQGFLVDMERFSSEGTLRNSSVTPSSISSSDAAHRTMPGTEDFIVAGSMSIPMATAMPAATTTSNPLPSTGPKPKIVATRGFLSVPGAGPFCACYAASRFLKGGVVTAPFLNDIMESGIELYRKKNENGVSIENVLRLYGKSHLGIQAIKSCEEDPKRGVFLDDDVQNDTGIRKLMATCRNEQEAGWQTILVGLQNDFFCVCLPPKGSSNKFWFLDFCRRTSVQTPGAYALVHSSLLQLEETMEAVFQNIGRRDEVDYVPFTLYRIKKIR
ncbi:MAG: hypothetical protein SGILL_002525 [Bacillariaceae sp.]